MLKQITNIANKAMPLSLSLRKNLHDYDIVA
jgi:hypothetical protein